MVEKALSAAFGQVLRESRERSGLSQEALASAANLDRTFISMLERGMRQPTLETLFRLSEALGVSAASLVSKTATLRG